MSYAKSKSRSDYESLSMKLRSLATSTDRIPFAELTYDHKNLINQALVVLLSSAIEEYNKSVIEDWFYQLRIQNAQMHQIPVNARMYGLLHRTAPHYRNYLYKKENEDKIIMELDKAKNDIHNLVNDNAVFSTSYLSKEVWGDKKYPSIKNMSILYNRIGIKNIFDQIAVRYHHNYKNQLDSLLSLREAIAHTGYTTVTYTDIIGHIDLVDKLINRLDRVLYTHCCKGAGSQYWPK